ncbi:tRNA threonylcarbamoyladenosine biosynthesis protein TsaB [Halomicronema hongdechloris C2206]|uniref:tRNA threonylcarbamoyladenosine biosynthesis protein TsaB n=1 Tax=Halomicronema hongdechloris C2206 TaxID=1641165 RepID=A0A1Z3HS13_9CYAN|nr:tRNA (adenosine(37)-N6)-threonylcarbamoyltransferase complex dimerization subunit type 1 TsaB [Halomicronema hongdechloris]ASC73085.1 tRNA threonylcarbamoyladenosine biosynthesis protein TsaB [Halomicronema hongdechloris C2206]
MLALAIHTTSPDLGLAISDFAGLTKRRVWPLGRELSTHFHGCLQEMVHPYGWAELEFIAVAQGPGGFTGTRIGVVTARTLAQQLSVPLFGVCSLAAVAAHEAGGTSQQLAVQMRSHRRDLFVAIYHPAPEGPKPQLPVQVMTPDRWQQTLAQWPHPYRLIEAEAGLGHTVSAVLELAYRRWGQGERPHWSQVLPYYGQHPVHR